MEPTRPLPLPLSPAARASAAALPFLLAATIPLIFDVLRDIPPGMCGDPRASDAVLSAYRSWATVLHVGVAVLALAAIVVTGDRPGRGPFGLGLPTFTVVLSMAVVAAVFAVFVALRSTSFWLLLPLLPFIFTAGFLTPLAQPLGPDVTGLVVAFLLICIAAAVWAPTVHDGYTAWPRACLWTLLLLIGGHLVLVFTQGTGGIGC